jgi:cell division protease FtsH
MVTEWGMSDSLGPLAYIEKDDSSLLGSTRVKDYSEQTAREIDQEVRRIVQEQYERAKKLLADNRDKLDRIAEALLERETLDREELTAIMEDRPLPEREKIVIPTYADKRKDSTEKKKGSIFQPRPREVPSAG